MNTPFDNKKGYTKLETPIDFGDFEAVGWFYYTQAAVHADGIPCVARELYAHIESKLRLTGGIQDNKYVVIFNDKKNFGTDDFAIYFKDCYAKVGKWETVCSYGAGKLEDKQ